MVLSRRSAFAVVMALLVAGCAGDHHSAASPTSTTVPATVQPTATSHTFTTTGRSVAGLTAEQLDAHMGVGVPDGWVPVDEGDARIWVPADMTVETEEGSSYCGEDDPKLPVSGLLGLGFANDLCPRHPKFRPRQSGSFVLSSAMPVNAPYKIVNGYRVYRLAPATSPSSDLYDVPQLGVQIALDGNLAARIIDTIAPSSSIVALAFATEPTPDTYRTITTDGISLSIPPRWAIATPRYTSCAWPASPTGAPEVIRVLPATVVGVCGALFGYAVILPNDGVSLFTSAGNSSPHRGQHAIAVMHHGSSTITVYPGTSIFFKDIADVFVHRAGSKFTHVLTLGLGRDGRVAGGVLASIRADT